MLKVGWGVPTKTLLERPSLAKVCDNDTGASGDGDFA